MKRSVDEAGLVCSEEVSPDTSFEGDATVATPPGLAPGGGAAAGCAARACAAAGGANVLATQWRCIDATHPQGCTLCRPAPGADEESAYEARGRSVASRWSL